MENDLYFYCPKCGDEVKAHPDTIPSLRAGIRVISNVCECGHTTKVRFSDCTTERRVPVEATAMWEVDGVPVPVTNEPDPYDTESRIYEEMKVVRQENERLVAERDEARGANRKLAESYLQMERERGEARAEVEALTGKVRLLEAGRDDRDARILSLSNCARGLSAEVERLKEHVTVLESGRDNSREKFVHFEGEVGRLTTETDYLRSMAKAYQDTAVERAERIAALEAVIAAQGEQAVAMSRNFHATLKVQEALNAAGLDAKVSLTSNCIEETP